LPFLPSFRILEYRTGVKQEIDDKAATTGMPERLREEGVDRW
jgi:hypothetical protein